MIFLSRETGRPTDAPFTVCEQLQRRAVIENSHAGLLHPLAHQTHVFRALQRNTLLLAVAVERERITPVSEGLHVAPGLFEDAVHPVVFRQIATARIAAGFGVFTLLRVRLDVPDGRARWRRSPGRPAVAFVRQHHTCALGRRTDRRPSARGSTPDHQHIGAPLTPAHALLQT